MKKLLFTAAGLLLASNLLAANQVVLDYAPSIEKRVAAYTPVTLAADNSAEEVVYSTSFEDNEAAKKITYFDLNADPEDKKNGKWSRSFNSFFAMFSRTGSWSMCYFYSKKNPGNDWFILEPIELKAGYYALKFWYSGDHEETLSVHWGEEAKPEAMTHPIVRYENFIESKYVESANVVHIEKDGVYYFGFKCESKPDENVLCIDDLTITKIKTTDPDLSVKQLSSSFGYLRPEMSQDVSFSVTNEGIKDLAGNRVSVSVNDNNILQDVYDLKAQETKSFTIEQALRKLEPGQHKLTIEVGNDEDKNTANNTIDYAFKVVKDPVVYYDFEDGVVPDGFQLKVVDEGKVNEGVSDLFPNNEAWNLVPIVSNIFFGEWMLASTSWFDNKVQADRWCILPKVHVDSENADLVWNANSADTQMKFAEDYEVLISTTDTEISSFTKVAEVKGENFATDPATRGMSLAKYAGKDIYVAFRLVSPDGYFMALDNIGFYGDVTGLETGVENVLQDGTEVTVNDTELTCHAGQVERIDLYDLSGRLVKSCEGRSSIEIGSLEKGVFVARIQADGKTLVHKFTR